MDTDAENNIRPIHQVLFWVVVITYFVITSDLGFFDGYQHLLESTLLLVSMQLLTAFVLIYVLIPRFLDKQKSSIFILSLLCMLSICLVLYMAVRVLYFDTHYQHTYNDIALFYMNKSFIDRLLDANLIVSKFVKFLTPAIILIMWKFYRNQKNYLQLKEQKKSAELSALRNQLNPHFLFNTLNNLYSLSISKSDKTPLVIEKLSEILDHILYQCNDIHVPIEKEVELIKNYIALEEIRYGERVTVRMQSTLDHTTKIGPLILLTFVENAFKHGVSQELMNAKITIEIKTSKAGIQFKIVNTKPKITSKSTNQSSELGLKNVQQQLKMLYGSQHILEIIDEHDLFTVNLKISQ